MKKPCAPGAVPSVSKALTSSTKTGGKDATYRSGPRTTASRPPPLGPSTPLVATVEQVTLKMKATSPFIPQPLKMSNKSVLFL